MDERYLSYPFRLTAEGRFATADADGHIRERMEQILFTSLGERVMLPEFGCGARDLLFAGNNEVLRAAAEFTIARALQTHLGDEAMINAVDVVSEDERLVIQVLYTRSSDLQQEQARFEMLPTPEASRG